jgi:hypothetical protein
MGLDIFFLEDIRNAILAANEASSATAEAATSGSTELTTGQDVQTLDLIAGKLREKLPEDKSRVLLDALHAAAVGNVDALKHYRRGYRAALITLALAFGLSPAIIDGDKPLEAPVLGGACPEPSQRVKGSSAISHPPSARKVMI